MTGPPTMKTNKTSLTDEQLEQFGEELDAIRQRVLADLGEEDAAYIRNVVKRRQQFEVAGRALFYLPPLWPLAVAVALACRRSSTTWRSATTSCTASTTGWATRA